MDGLLEVRTDRCDREVSPVLFWLLQHVLTAEQALSTALSAGASVERTGVGAERQAWRGRNRLH